MFCIGNKFSDIGIKNLGLGLNKLIKLNRFLLHL